MKTYGELKTAVANWLDREDLVDNIPDFVRLCETKIYRNLRTRENEFLLDISVTGNPITLPENFREVKLVTMSGKVVQRISDQEYRRREGSSAGQITAAKYNSYFTIMARGLYLYPAETTGTLNLSYYGTESLTDMCVDGAAPTPPTSITLSDDATTRLLQVAPDVLLYGTLLEATMFLKEDPRIPLWQAQYAQGMAELTQENSIAEYAGSTVQVSGAYGD